MTKVHRSKHGLFFRIDSNLGLLVYSPFTGLFYSCIEDSKGISEIISWIEGKSESPSEKYKTSIGAGWACSLSSANLKRHVLSDSGKLIGIPKPDFPILINWLITERCQCECVYCYSTDLMRERHEEPSAFKVSEIAENILAYNPVAVALTGGDPLCSPHIGLALEKLQGKTGLIVDTNGIGITDVHLRLFKKYHVFVRISFDSEIPNVNNSLRPTKHANTCTLRAALECMNVCMKNKISVGVQSVITKKNLSDIISMQYKLQKLGVTNWRLQMLANHSCFNNYKDFNPNRKRFAESIYSSLKNNEAGHEKQSQRMSIQLLKNNESNAVILVAPSGDFLTEYNGKQLLDPKNHKKPSMKAIKEGVLNLEAHTDRYLDISEMK